ncbi:MAG: 16S rRNA (cytosine(1402)-N(4))-methyltransferase RsmH [Bacteriovoracales bacterium]|nr:16S rRNA (cytosine(1402)-N(4))-methyltransferase RsmH [Bacteriovoracales bacterium]
MPYEVHTPVLKDEIIDIFVPKGSEEEKEKCYFCDCTFGGGGHSFALLEKNPHLNIVAFDQDLEAIENGLKKIKKENRQEKIHLIHANFSSIEEKLNQMGLSGRISGILFDLGVSSHHLNDPSRGFSFLRDGPLDMRMNRDSSYLPSAKEILEQKSEREIADILFRYGEEKHSRLIASKIVEFRSRNDLNSTKQLENIVFHCYPRKERYRGVHPATKTFQALRLFVNEELKALEKTLPDALKILKKGGLIAVISFHSLEDRIVKHFFRSLAKKGEGSLIGKKPILPTAAEIQTNKRARSAKLRVFQLKPSM